MTLAVLRLRRSSPRFPLRKLWISPALCTAPQFLSALASTFTLTCLRFDPDPSGAECKDTASLAVQLKAIKTVNLLDLKWFPKDKSLELLQSRTNWFSISLPADLELPGVSARLRHSTAQTFA
jgi:hypothetical protein